jgi:hypothetical protein
VDANGFHLEKGLVTRIEKWPSCTNTTDVRSFLGTVGVGRKWIKSFALIAKPLTELLRASEQGFAWSERAQEAMDHLKNAVTSAPVLCVIDYPLALTFKPNYSETHGLVCLAVDSCIYGSGWILSQIIHGFSHPALYASCTFSAPVSKYSQPKCELYGLFRAVKDVRHRIWGLHFQLEVDASFLGKMIVSPDLPNAPMTRWVSYIQLFDFTVKHVPATSHKAADGLSRRPRAPDDSDDEIEAEEYLTNTVGLCLFDFADDPLNLKSIRLPAPRTRPLIAYVDYVDVNSTREAALISESALVTTWYEKHLDDLLNNDPVGQNFSLSNAITWEHRDSLYMRCALRFSDEATFMGRDFYARNVPVTYSAEVLLGDRLESLSFTEYHWQHLATPENEATTIMDPDTPFDWDDQITFNMPLRRSDHRLHYSMVPSLPDTWFSAPTHASGKPDIEDDQLWDDITQYLLKSTIPRRFDSTASSRRTFINKARRYLVQQEVFDGAIIARLFRYGSKGASPRLVITDKSRRKVLIAMAHNECGHRGRDPTYKKLADRYYWPNLYRQVEWFTRSCYPCQLRDKQRPIVPILPSTPMAIFTKVCLDTKSYTEDGYNGFKYLLRAVFATSGWPEARAARSSDAETWAKFIWEEILCRFSIIPFFVTDGGSEFKGAAEILLKKHGVTIFVSAPYHPQANGIVERSHDSFDKSLIVCCGDKPRLWPLFVHGTLLAIRTTTSRVTGQSPYYLVYGTNPKFSFDFEDRTWETLDWHAVKDTGDLIALRTLQITRRDQVLEGAILRQSHSRQQGITNYLSKNKNRLTPGEFPLGVWVLRRESWIDSQKGNKTAFKWLGPFIIHKREGANTYQLREIDGSIITSICSSERLKIFYYREEMQTLRTLITTQKNNSTDVPGFISPQPNTDAPEASAPPSTKIWNTPREPSPDSASEDDDLDDHDMDVDQYAAIVSACHYTREPAVTINYLDRADIFPTLGHSQAHLAYTDSSDWNTSSGTVQDLLDVQDSDVGTTLRSDEDFLACSSWTSAGARLWPRKYSRYPLTSTNANEILRMARQQDDLR